MHFAFREPIIGCVACSTEGLKLQCLVSDLGLLKPSGAGGRQSLGSQFERARCVQSGGSQTRAQFALSIPLN